MDARVATASKAKCEERGMMPVMKSGGDVSPPLWSSDDTAFRMGLVGICRQRFVRDEVEVAFDR